MYRHAKRSHMHNQDLVVHVRDWWIMKTIKIIWHALNVSEASECSKAGEIHSAKCLKVCDSSWIKQQQRNQLTDGFVVCQIGVDFCPFRFQQKNKIQNIVYFWQ